MSIAAAFGTVTYAIFQIEGRQETIVEMISATGMGTLACAQAADQ